MIYPIVCVRDKKVGFMAPQMEPNIDAAKRNFAWMINSVEGIPQYTPGDFDFYHVADFDSEKGVIYPINPIEMICDGMNVYNAN